MPLNWSNSNAPTADVGVTIIVYGKTGVGKTSLAATCDAPIILSCESGTLSLKSANVARMFGPENPYGNADIPILQINSLQDMNDALAWLRTEAAASFRTIFFDGLSEFGEMLLAEAKPQFNDNRLAYGQVEEVFGGILRQLRDWPNKHFVGTARMERIKTEAGVLFHPAFPGNKFAQKVPSLFDELLKLDVAEDAQGVSYRYFATQPSPQFEAKDRSGALASVEVANISAVIQKIEAVA